MKKMILSLLLVVLALGLFAGTAAAQGGRSPREGRGVMFDYIKTALAEKLAIEVADLDAQLVAGTTLGQVALDNGITEADLPAFMQEVHEAAFAAAVSDGVLTQAQADEMLQRFASRGYGTGTCTMGGTRPQDGSGLHHGRGMGMRGWARWQQVNP